MFRVRIVVNTECECYTACIMKSKVAERIWARDASLWKTDDDSKKVINNSLGWLTVADEMLGVADELTEFAESIRARGFQHVMVCGMGGSSLCREVLARTFGRQEGFPELLVLDSTDADVIAAFTERIDVERCLFIIASKSGTTTEPNVFENSGTKRCASEARIRETTSSRLRIPVHPWSRV